MKRKIISPILGLILTVSSCIQPVVTQASVIRNFIQSATAMETKRDVAKDKATNNDTYKKYLEEGIDITLPEYKTMRPDLELRNPEEVKEFALNKIKIIPKSGEFVNEDGSPNWNMKINRGQYAEIITNFVKYYKISKQPCCMGDSPDFTETSKTDKYYNSIVFAANNGFYCTSKGSDGNKPFTVRELDKYLYKLCDDMKLPDGFYNSIFTQEEAYNNISELNYCLENESDITKKMISTLYRYNLLPRDMFYRINLDAELTLYELTDILVSCGDIYKGYNSQKAKTTLCMDCVFLNVDSLYK